MALRIRGLSRRRTGTDVPRLGSLRMILLVLAVIPSLALAALWGVSTAQLAVDWREQDQHADLAARGIPLARDVALNLQEERRLSAEVLANANTSPAALHAQRGRTDRAVRAFRAGTGGGGTELHTELREALGTARENLGLLPGIRANTDDESTTQNVVFESFTMLIDSDLRLVEALGNVDDGEVTVKARPLADLLWAEEMLAREDAVLARGWAADRIKKQERSNLGEWIGTQEFLLTSRVEPQLPEDDRELYQQLVTSSPWRTKTVVEQTLLQSHPHDADALPREASQWRQAVEELQPHIVELVDHRAADFSTAAGDSVRALLVRMVVSSAVGLGAVVIVIILSVRLATSLRRRILALRDEAERLEKELPEVVERLQRGEVVDIDAEVREIRHGDDELGRLGQALNLARRSAVETAVRETEQHRGFQRLLQRIARRTQLLIGLQLKKLDEMERRHENPEVLNGLFDLDHLTARLRRYEENLVILGGGQPQRRWRKPVRVVDVLRAALGEVQDYRRIQIEVQGRPWLAERAVGPVTHILAELMENATAFSKPPNPVEARAGLVGRGLVVEIEDRGLGMEQEEYERINQVMTDPPRIDMISRADDARLGLYVVSRLADGLGLTVDFRPSVFGGTRVIVMVPAELVAGPPEDADAGTGESPLPGTRRGDAHLEARTAEQSGTEQSGTEHTGDDGNGIRTDGIRTDGGAPEREREEAGGAGEPAGQPAGDHEHGGRRAPAWAAGSGPARGGAGGPGADGAPAGLPSRARGKALEAVTAGFGGPGDGTAAPEQTRATSPLPKRVRQASLTAELRRPPGRPAEDDAPQPHPAPRRSGAALGAFQRQSRRVRQPDAPENRTASGAVTPERSNTTREDGS